MTLTLQEVESKIEALNKRRSELERKQAGRMVADTTIEQAVTTIDKEVARLEKVRGTLLVADLIDEQQPSPQSAPKTSGAVPRLPMRLLDCQVFERIAEDPIPPVSESLADLGVDGVSDLIKRAQHFEATHIAELIDGEDMPSDSVREKANAAGWSEAKLLAVHKAGMEDPVRYTWQTHLGVFLSLASLALHLRGLEVRARIDCERLAKRVAELEAAQPKLKYRVDAIEARPTLKYCKVWIEGAQYNLGDVVTHQGCAWHCNEPTRDKPNESGSWTLMVKRGRDGQRVVDGRSHRND